MKTIDITKPLQLTDGRKAVYVGPSISFPGYHRVQVAGSAGDKVFSPTGRHKFGILPSLQNVPGYNIEIGTELFFGDLALDFRAEVKFLSETACVARSRNGCLYEIQLDTMEDQSGDKWNIVVPETTEWINVYADGSCGSTRHKSRETALYATKNGKTRVGILKRVLRADEVVSAEVEPTEPRMRDRNVMPQNPFTGEVA